MSAPAHRTLGRELREDFGGKSVVATVVGGLVVGAVGVGFTISYAALIFQEDLSRDLAIGTGTLLVATLVIGVITALWSSVRGLIASVQDTTSAVLGVAAVAATAEVADGDAIHVAIALLAVASIATGVVLFAAGRFGLGGVARFLPYTLIGGFLAATGVVIIDGGLSILDSGVGSSFWPVWAPGFAMAAGFLVLQRLPKTSVTFPLGIVLGVIAMHIAFLVADVGRTEAGARGWVLAGEGGASWSPQLIVEALGADWGPIFGQIGAIATAATLAAVSLLLYAHALEAALHRDVDLNRELMVAGAGNVAAGLAGGPPGYLVAADTILLSRVGRLNRGAALVATGVSGAALAAGPSLLSFVPTAVVGGLLVYVGSSFLIEWLWDSRRSMTAIDRAVIIAVVVTVVIAGFVAGVVVGLVLAVITFVIQYSRVGVIERSRTIDEVPVSMERPPDELELIEAAASSTLVLELRGFLFFGTAHNLVVVVEGRLATDSPLRYVVFDLTGVSGLDAAAIGSFDRVVRYAREHDFSIVLVGDPVVTDRIAGDASDDVVSSFHGLDEAVRWCQHEIIREATDAPADATSADLESVIAQDLGADAAQEALAMFTRIDVAAGRRLIEQGGAASGLYYLESGRLTVVAEQPSGEVVRLRTMRPGTVVGEMSLYRGAAASATVVADAPSVVMHLSAEQFASLDASSSDVAAWLHRFVAEVLASRVDHANKLIRAISR